MDPLSIAASAAGLAAVCIKITKWLYDVIDDNRRADQSLAELFSEITTLNGALLSLKSTIDGCRSQLQALSYIDNDIWLGVDSQVAECRTSLCMLDNLLGRIHDSTLRSKVFKKGNIQAKLILYSRDIKGYKDVVHTHYRAILMAVGTINVSLSVRTSASQDRIFLELKELHKLIELAITTSHEQKARLAAVYNPRLEKLTNNLQSLARSVQAFHATASTAASSASGSSRWGGSVVGEMPPAMRDYIGNWQNTMRTVTKDASTTTNAAPVAFRSDLGNNITPSITPSPRPPEEQYSKNAIGYNLGLDYDSDLDAEINENISQLAKEAYHRRHFDQADLFLQSRLSKFRSVRSRAPPSPADLSELYLTQLRLACCQLARRWWGSCGSILLALAQGPAEHEVLEQLPTLLHATAIGLLSEGKLVEAGRLGKLALQRNRKAWGKSSAKYAHSLALLVRIARKGGNEVEAQALTRAIPSNYARLDVMLDENITGLGYLSSSADLKRVLNELWRVKPPVTGSAETDLTIGGTFPNYLDMITGLKAPKDNRRGVESETDTFKEVVSDLYIYVQSLLRHNPGLVPTVPPLPPAMAVFGTHGRITYIRRSGLGVESDMMTILNYARFVEKCDRAMRGFLPARWNGREPHAYKLNYSDSKRARELEDAALATRERNSTDTYKEVCSPPHIYNFHGDRRSPIEHQSH